MNTKDIQVRKRAVKIKRLISQKVGKAIVDYNMIEDGDRIVVAVSGGKDSLTLIEILRDRQRYAPIKFELLPVHIKLDFQNLNLDILERYFKENGYDYYIEPLNILGGNDKVECFYCAWSRKKALFEITDRLGAKKIAIAHNKDDIIETFFLNLIFHAEISALKPVGKFFDDKFWIIRPLMYVEKKETMELADLYNLPVLNFDCPYQGSKRRVIKELLEILEDKCDKHAKTNIFNALKRVKKDYLL
ncbi:TPA: tRNA 2-thiocytidine(32) synthetase TtcA [bacterium]|nr:tRNA 2-thiocytidine(32) synthetase TtcA [bacterium]